MRCSMLADAGHANYVISAREVIWGGILIATTLLFHAVGMMTTLRATRAMAARVKTRGSFIHGAQLLVVASWMIVLTHGCEVMLWAAFFTLRGALPSWSTANYYTLLQYTTVGSGLSLPYDWRLLGGMLPMAGTLTFAWSTAVLLSLVVVFEEGQLMRRGARGGKSD
jgi:hypothetical protein